MSWALNEGTAAILLVSAELFVLSPGFRRVFVRAGHAGVGLTRRAGMVSPVPDAPLGRPIEVIAQEARRLGQRFRRTRQGVSYAKSEAIRRAYDDVLGEGCDAIGVAHQLGVHEPGEELDAERVRVERLLHIWGLDLDDAA